MIFAAGFGTRLKPLTDSKPKALVEIGGRTFLEIVIRKLLRAGADEIVVNVHHFADKIEEYLKAKNNFGVCIHISDERDFLLDTGGGLKKAAPFLEGNEPVIIHNVDVLSNLDLANVVAFHLKKKALATIVARERQTQRYLLFDQNHRLVGWENIQTGETKIVDPRKFVNAAPLAFSGIQVLNPEIFSLITQEGKFSIIDTYLELAKDYKILAYTDQSDLWMDIGKPAELEEATRLFGEGKLIL